MSQDSKNSITGSQSDSQVSIKPKCPQCGFSGVCFRADAWEVRTLCGFDDDGEPILDEPDYEVFDDSHFECDRCGYKCSEAGDFYRDPAT